MKDLRDSLTNSFRSGQKKYSISRHENRETDEHHALAAVLAMLTYFKENENSLLHLHLVIKQTLLSKETYKGENNQATSNRDLV